MEKGKINTTTRGAAEFVKGCELMLGPGGRLRRHDE